MLKRFIALVMACLLAAGALPALAELDSIGIDDEIVLDAFDEVIDENSLDLSIDALNASVSANAAKDDELLPTELRIKKSASKKVTLGYDYQIVIPGKKIKSCKSSNKKIATVTDKGLIHTKKAGSVKITITPKKGSKLKLKLKVIDPSVPTDVTIDQGTSATLAIGDTKQFTATVTPDTASQKVVWKSSDKSVATVDKNGRVKALAVGSTTISATTGNDLKAKLSLKVKKTASGNYMISHAMGGIDGYQYSNCLEGFLENYREGHRIFEVDIEITSDNKMVLWHDWNRQFCSKYKKGRKPTYAEFMKSKIFDEYTPMDIEALLRLMHKYPKVRIITDSKYTKTSTIKKQFKTIVSTAKKLGMSDVLDRFVVEIYDKDMFKTVDQIYHFKEYMFTLYKAFKKAPTKTQLVNVAKFCKKKGISTIAMYAKWWKPKYAKYVEPYGLDLALYTVNSASDARDYFDDGVTALFTDFLPPV